MRYQVISKNHKVFGKKHGEYFERNIPEAQERILIGGGFIVRAPVKKRKTGSQLQPVVGASSFDAVVLVKEPSAATDDAPTDVPNDDASTNPPEGMNTDEQEANPA